MREVKHETIIIEKEGWEFLKNQTLVMRGFKPRTQEQLDKEWNRIDRNGFRNDGANLKTHPIEENEIRVDPDEFSIGWDKIKQLIKDNGIKYRQDGYEVEGICLSI